MSKLSIRDLDLKGKRTFIRVDFNVPLAPGGQKITSDNRIIASLPTIKYALEHGAGVILASHLGRPRGTPNPELSLKPVAKRLGELLGCPVMMAPDCVGPEVEVMKPAAGEVLPLENLRFHAGEEKNDPTFSMQLAGLCYIYINDAFGSAHRAHASTVGITKFVTKAGAGLLMVQELNYLTMATQNPPRPCITIMGGVKVSDKIKLISHLGKFADKLLIGGAIAYTFLKSQGIPVGDSRVENDKLELAASLVASLGDKLLLPVDHIVVTEVKDGARYQVVDTIQAGQIGVDIGPRTIASYCRVITDAKTLIWNGPMGVFEISPFEWGTTALGKSATLWGAFSMVCGGDTEKAVKSAGVADKISYISTGGGATLEFLAGNELPGVAALPEKCGSNQIDARPGDGSITQEKGAYLEMAPSL